MTATASKWMITLLACAVSLGLAQSARAQTTPPPSPGQGGQDVQDGVEVKGNFVTMLTLVLNLTADQQSQVKAIFEATRAQAKVITDNTTLSQDDKMMKIKELREAANTKIKPLLTPDQQQKFDELQKQLSDGTGTPHPGPDPMGDPVAMLTTALSLTADQKTQIQGIFEAMHPQMKTIEDDTTLSQDKKMAKMKDLRNATHAKIKALLTPDQRQKFDEILKQQHS